MEPLKPRPLTIVELCRAVGAQLPLNAQPKKEETMPTPKPRTR